MSFYNTMSWQPQLSCLILKKDANDENAHLHVSEQVFRKQGGIIVAMSICYTVHGHKTYQSVL